MLRLTLVSLAAAATIAACAPTGTSPAATANVDLSGTPGTRSGRCGLINIGRPDQPRLVHDPACSYGSN